MAFETLSALSPIDGRYAQLTDPLRAVLSEQALIYYRVLVEVKWFQALSQHSEIKEIPSLTQGANQFLNDIIAQLDIKEIQAIKEIEKKTNHDVKAVEYYLKEKFNTHPELSAFSEFIHFSCTSEDINNLAYALMLKQSRTDCLIPKLREVINALTVIAKQYAATPMLSRTHGQSASPTTVGKEIANTVWRLKRQHKLLADAPIYGKINGAVGNFNAHCIAYPEVNWMQLSEEFVNSLGLKWQPLTTQIEPHDFMSEYFHIHMRINTILIDFSRDVWGYISLGYFKQKLKDGEVGSSTMPHKVNPIDFENAEGNLGLASAILGFMSEKLPVSRWQRDLSDSTTLRNIGVGLGHTFIGYCTLLRGINKLDIDEKRLAEDLDSHWEVLAEAIQTVMRRYGLPEPYEQLKQLTRGQSFNQSTLKKFIDTIELPETVKHQLLTLTPSTYLGIAKELVALL